MFLLAECPSGHTLTKAASTSAQTLTHTLTKMFRQLARLAEEHELLEAFPFLRGGSEDEEDLIQDAIAALPPLVARFFFAPRGGPKAPPLLGRCFTLKKLSAPHDVREACLRGAANSFRFRAEYRWSACAVGFVAGFADGSTWSASWLVAEAACVVLARAPPAVAFPTEDLKARRAAARKAARRRRLAGRRVCVKNVGADQCRNQRERALPRHRGDSGSISKQAPARSSSRTARCGSATTAATSTPSTRA